MFGALIGDIAGSRFEWRNHKSKDFDLFIKQCRPTDDSIMSLAVCRALIDSAPDYTELEQNAVRSMQELGRLYRDAGYGGRFHAWLGQEHPRPYYSFGNGAAMRVSGCGWAAGSLEQAKEFARAVTCVTHDHPEGLKAGEAVACAVYLARTGSSMDELRRFILDGYYNIDFTLDGIRKYYTFDVTCQGSVPQAFEAFFESRDFEDAVRVAVSIGGDSDTIAAITGAVAGAYYGVPGDLRACSRFSRRKTDGHTDRFRTDVSRSCQRISRAGFFHDAPAFPLFAFA